MSDIILVPNLGYVGANPCYNTEQDRYVDYMSKTVWTLPLGELSGVYVSDTPPADNSYVWFQIDPTTKGQVYPTPFLYSTHYGQWIALYPVPALDNERRLWVGTPVELETYDGGAAGAVTDTTGPFWEIDTDFEDRIPGGVKAAGTIAAVSTDYDANEAQTAAPNTVQVRGTYIIKRTARVYYTP